MKLISIILLALALIPLECFSQQAARLFLNKKITASISQNSVKTFSFPVEQGKNYTIHAEQKGIDIALRLNDAEGKEIIYRDSPNGKYGPEIIEFTASKSRELTLIVTPLKEQGNAVKGKFSLLVTISQPLKTDSIIQQILQPREMKEDLQAFIKIRKKANSGLYRYRTQQEIDSLFQWAFNQIQEPLTINEFYKIITLLTDFEGSNHNGTKLPYHPAYYISGNTGYFPFFLKKTGNNQMVVNYEGSEIPLGSQILSINGVSDKELQQKLSKYFPTDGYNQTAKDKAAIENSFGWIFPFENGTSAEFIIEFKRPGSSVNETISIPSISREENRNRFINRHSARVDSLINNQVQDKYSFQKIDQQTALLNFRVFDMANNEEDPAFKTYSDFLDSVFTLLKTEHYKHLVIDIRNNPGGNDPTYEKAFTYLTDHPFKENTLAYIIFKKLPYPRYFDWNSSDKSNQKHELKNLNSYLQSVFSEREGNKFLQHQKYNPIYSPDTAHAFSGKVYLLIDENVGSAASHFASLVRGYTDATIVGMETSGGYYGHNGHFPVEYQLPNSKIKTRFSIVYVEQDAPQKSSQPIGRGIIPDYIVSQSYEDFIKNEDSQMKFILNLISTKK